MAKLPPRRPRSWQVQRPPQAGRTFVNPWYHTPAWRALRAAILRDEPLCRECKKEGIITPANLVDHIKQVSSGYSDVDRECLMWDENNLQPLCNSCHNRKSAKEKNRH